MTFQEEMTAAAQEYARSLDKQREADRLAALKLEARHETNAAAFAEFIDARFTELDTTLEEML